MGSKNLETVPILARRELRLLICTAFVDPFHLKRFSLMRDPDFSFNILSRAELPASERPKMELGPGDVSARKLKPDALFAVFDAEPERAVGMERQAIERTDHEFAPYTRRNVPNITKHITTDEAEPTCLERVYGAAAGCS